MKGDLVGRMGTGVDRQNREQLAHVPELHHARGVAGSNGVPLPKMGAKSKHCLSTVSIKALARCWAVRHSYCI